MSGLSLDSESSIVRSFLDGSHFSCIYLPRAVDPSHFFEMGDFPPMGIIDYYEFLCINIDLSDSASDVGENFG